MTSNKPKIDFMYVSRFCRTLHWFNFALSDSFSFSAQPRYPQTTFWGRFRHFMDVTDMRTLFTTKAQLAEAQDILKNYAADLEDYDAETLWGAKKSRVFECFCLCAFVFKCHFLRRLNYICL